MRLFLSFVFSASVVWALAIACLGNPGILRGPWSTDSLLRLKRTEQFAYFIIVSLIPFLTLTVNAILTQWAKKQATQTTPRVPLFLKYPECILLPWLSLPLILAQQRPSPFSLVLIPFSMSAIILLVSSLVKGKQKKRNDQNSIPPSPPNKEIRQGSPGWVFGLIIPILLYLGVPRMGPKDLLQHMDDGLRLTAAAEFEKGKLIYQDVFLNYGPLFEIGQTRAAFWLFGRSWESLRKMDLLIEPLPYVAAYFLLLGAVRRRGWVLMLFPIVTKTPFWMTPRIVLPLTTLTCLVWGWRASKAWGRRAWAGAAGIVWGGALLYSLEAGLLVGATLFSFYGAWILWNKIKRNEIRKVFLESGFVAAGFLSIFLPFLSWIILTGRFKAFCFNIHAVSVTALVFGAKPTPILFEPLWRFVTNPLVLFRSEGVLFRLWFPVGVYVGTLSWIFGQKKTSPFDEENRPLLLLTLSGLFFFLVTLGRWDIDHWWKATGPFWPLGILVLDRVILALKTPFQWQAWSGSLLVVFFLGRYLIFHTHPTQTLRFLRDNTSLLIEMAKTPRATDVLGPMLMKREDVQEIREVLSRLHRWSPPDQPLFIFGNQGTFYFLSGRSPPPPFHMECYIMSEAMAVVAVESLREHPPACVMAEIDGEGYSHRAFQKVLMDYIRENYVEADRWGSHAFLVRRPFPR